MELTNREDAPFGIFATFERVHFPPRGRDNGGSGSKGRISLASGEVLRNKGFQAIPKSDRLIVEMPGGGGYGDPMTQDADAVAEDVRAGFIDTATAEKDYGVIVSEDFTVDAVRTAVRRQAAGD